MTQFYSIRHNTAYTRGMPEIYQFVAGLRDFGRCPTCGSSRREPSGDVQVELGQTRAKVWPDAIACGDYPCLVISERFVKALNEYDAGFVLGGEVSFVEPNLSGLPFDTSPRYFWVDGKHSVAGKMDFEASGYVDVRFCPECGNRTDNISLTYKRQHADPPPGQVFDYDDSSGLDLFTTDLAPTAFFCTERVFEAARANRLVNLAFIPTDRPRAGKRAVY